MLGEESHKATLDSSAGDNRVVCAVIYAVWHGEVALAAWHCGCLPHGKETTVAVAGTGLPVHRFSNLWQEGGELESISLLNREPRRQKETGEPWGAIQEMWEPQESPCDFIAPSSLPLPPNTFTLIHLAPEIMLWLQMAQGGLAHPRTF